MKSSTPAMCYPETEHLWDLSVVRGYRCVVRDRLRRSSRSTIPCAFRVRLDHAITQVAGEAEIKYHLESYVADRSPAHSGPRTSDALFRCFGFGMARRLGSSVDGYFFCFFFLSLYSVSSRHFTEAHSRITASSFGIVLVSSCSSTIPSAIVLATLSKAAPTSLISLDITFNSRSDVVPDPWVLKS